MNTPKLHRAPIAVKLAFSLFVVVAAAGLVASLLLVSHSLHDTEDWAWPELESLRLKYAAAPLERAVRTTMAEYLDAPSESEPLLDWCRAGGERSGYYEKVAPLINRRCLRCHGGESTRADVDLSTWGDLAPLSLGRGPAWRDLMRSSHLHLFGIGLLLLAVGGLLWFSRWPLRLRLILPLAAFAGLLLDIGGWWLARVFDAATLLILTGGLVLTAGLALSVALALIDMWRPEGDPSKG